MQYAQASEKPGLGRKRSHRALRPEKQVHVLSQVNLGANFEQEPQRKHPKNQGLAVQSPNYVSADLQHLADNMSKLTTNRPSPQENRGKLR